MNTVINIIKPTGISSNKILSIVKNKYKGFKVGHFGTLDPMATGVLPIAVGKATKLFDYFLSKDKEYIAVIQFGKETDTLDSEGTVINQSNIIPSLNDLNKIIKEFIGNICQIPPQYSALKVNGMCAYDLARSGKIANLPTRNVNIYDITVLNQLSYNSYLLKIHCSSGTYIRSLIRDIAYKLNTFAYMPQLIRTRAGCFDINNAYTVDEFKNNKYKIYSIEQIVNLPKIIIPNNYYEKLVNGVSFEYTNINETRDFLLYCKDELFGIANIINGKIKIKTNLRETL